MRYRLEVEPTAQIRRHLRELRDGRVVLMMSPAPDTSSPPGPSSAGLPRDRPCG